MDLLIFEGLKNVRYLKNETKYGKSYPRCSRVEEVMLCLNKEKFY